MPTHMAVMCWYICMEYECECSSACSAFVVWAVGVGRMSWYHRNCVRLGLDGLCAGPGAEGVNLTL